MNHNTKQSFKGLCRRILSLLTAAIMLFQTGLVSLPETALADEGHTIRFYGVGSNTLDSGNKLINPLVSSGWTTSTGGTIDGPGAKLITSGNYSSSGGVQARFYTDLGTVSSIRFSFGETNVTLTGAEISSSGIHINENGTKTSVKAANSIVKYAYSSGGRFLRFYKITQDIDIIVNYEGAPATVSGSFEDPLEVTSSFKYDTKTDNTSVDGNSFSAPLTDFEGGEVTSVRMAIVPTANMTGLRLSKSDGTEVATFKYGDNANPRAYPGVGNIAMAYSNADSTYYVRFLYLLTDVVISPVVNPDAGLYKITFDPNGGVIDGEKDYLITSGGKLGSLLSVVSPRVVGDTKYTFDGWYTSGNVKVSTATAFTKDETLTAHWNETSVTLATVSVSGATSTGGDIVSALDSKWKSVDTSKGIGYLAEGFTDAAGAGLKIYTAYGVLKEVQVKVGDALPATVPASSLISDTSGKTVYINSSYDASSSSASGDILKLAHGAGDKFFTAVIYDATENIEISFKFNDLKATFMADGAEFASVTVPFGTAVEEPSDNPVKEGKSFDKWCSDDLLTDPYSFETVVYEDLTLYAKMKDQLSVEIFYGYGKARGKEKVLSDIVTLTDTGYSLKGILTEEYKNGPESPATGNCYDHPNQNEISSIDIYYDGATTPSYTLYSQLSAKGNPVIKGTVFLGTDGTLNGTSGTRLIKFAASKDAQNVPMATRWYNVPASLKVVINYFDTAKTVTIDGGAGATITRENIPDVYYKETDGKGEISVDGSFDSKANAFSVTVTPVPGKEVDYITFASGSKTASVSKANLEKTLYLTKSFTLSATSSADDIAMYNNGKISFYKVDSDISVTYSYVAKITFDPNGGVVIGTDTAYTVDGKLTSLPAVETPRIDGGTTYYFMGWYDGPDMNTAKRVTKATVFSANTTVYAGWSDVQACRIEVADVYPADGSDPASTSTPTEWLSFDETTGGGTLIMNYSGEAQLTANLFYGKVKTVEVDLDGSVVSVPAIALFDDTSDKIVYIDSSGTASNIPHAGDIMSITHRAGEKTLNIRLFSISKSITVDFTYEDVTATFMYDGETYLTKPVSFGTAPSAPDEPTADGIVFGGWYADSAFTGAYDFSQILLVDTTIYGQAKHIRTISFEGMGGKTTGAIAASTWAASTGGTVDEGGILTTVGDYHNTTGVQVRMYPELGILSSITFAYSGHELTVSGDDLFNTTGFYFKTNGTRTAASGTTADVIVKYGYTTSNGGGYFLRFYNIACDVTITAAYSNITSTTVKGTLSDPAGAVKSYEFDTVTENTVISGSSFTVPYTDLRGTNAHSLRLTIIPDASVMTGLKLSDGVNEYTYVYGDSTDARYYDGIGRIAMAFSSSDGKYYVRFLTLTKNVTITPISIAKGTEYTVNIDSAKDLPVTSDKGNVVNVKLSDDNRTVTAATGVLKSSDTKESFRFNFANTIGTDVEYYKAEFYYKDTGKLLGTVGAGLSSYKGRTSDETVSFNHPDFSAKYNKSKYGEAQLRVWGVKKNIEVKIYYKNYKTGEVISAANAKFGYTAKVSFVRSATDAKLGKYAFDFITPGTKVSGLSATIPTNELTGDNTIIKMDGDVKISGVFRFRISALRMNEVKSLTVTDGVYTKTFTKGETYTGQMGNFLFARNGNSVLLRVNRIYTTNELKVSATFIDNSIEGPYNVQLKADSRIGVTYETTNPSSVKTSKDHMKLTIPEGALTEPVSGKSVRWLFSSMAGMDFEYSKLEIYDSDSGELLKTLGDDFVSYKDSAKDQYRSAELAGLKIRYNKNTYGELQIRIWEVYRNLTLKMYYKNYKTGQECAAGDKAMKIGYSGVVTFNANGANVETEIAGGSPVSKLDGYRRIRFNGFTDEAHGVRYHIKPANQGERVESIRVTIDGKTVTMGSGTEIYKAKGQVFAGAKIRFAMSTDGYAFVRVYGVTRNVKISVNISGGHKSTITFDVGEHGSFRIMDIPVNAIISPDLTKITVLTGATYNSKAGEKTSIRYDVKVEPGWEIDYITLTTKGRTYKMDNKGLPTGKTLTVQAAAGCAIRYNTDANGNTQIRAVHIDADAKVRVFYRTHEYTFTVNNGALSTMKAEPYGTSCETVFTDNFAVARIKSGNTVARQNGIKYWLEPLNGKAITGAVVSNSKGEFLVMGQGFGATEYEDYKLQGGTVRYYQGYDGKMELRVWGVRDDLLVTVFYDGEQMTGPKAVPADIATYDVGPYDPTKRVDNMVLTGDPAAADPDAYKYVPASNDSENPDESAGQSSGMSMGLIIGIAAGAVVLVGGAAAGIIVASKKKKKEE